MGRSQLEEKIQTVLMKTHKLGDQSRQVGFAPRDTDESPSFPHGHVSEDED